MDLRTIAAERLVSSFPTTTSPPHRTRQACWLRGPATDSALALAWVPFAIAAGVAGGHPTALRTLAAATLTLSFAHQPLTLALVYGDRAQFASRARLFTFAPLVLLALVAVGQQVSLSLLAVVAGLWNAGHTLMQRYGVLRIYGRKTGHTKGGLERFLLWSWLTLALIWAAADSATPRRLDEIGLGGVNRRGADMLGDLAPAARVLLPLIAVVAVILLVAWILDQRYLSNTNPAAWPYLASTAILFMVFLANPIAGFIGYVGAHAVEYFTLVGLHVGSRYPDPVTDHGALVGRAVRARSGSLGFLAGYAASVSLLILLLEWRGNGRLSTLVIFTLGGMHLLYDGFIWKLRRPEVARGFRTDPSG